MSWPWGGDNVVDPDGKKEKQIAIVAIIAAAIAIFYLVSYAVKGQ